MSKGRMSSAMSSGPAVACMKTLMMIFNFIFWVTGLAVLGIGIWIKVQLHIYMELSNMYAPVFPYALIGFGCALVLVGSLGCCCTVKGHSCLLYMYAAFLMLVFVVELGAGIAGFVSKSKLENGFKEGLKGAYHAYGIKGNEDKTEAVDFLQRQLDCCGITNYTDWFATPWENEQKDKKSVPKSCCKDEAKCKTTGLPDNPGNSTRDINTEGCHKKVVDFMNGNMGAIGGVALGISFLQLFGSLLACYLAKNLNKSKYEQVA